MTNFPPALVFAARVLGIPALAGINLYLTVFSLGLIKKFTGDAVLGAEFALFANTAVLIVAGVLTVVEIIADKIPAVDHVWDGIHTFIRAPGAMIIITVISQGQDPAWQIIAVLVAGVASFATHASKATVRVGATKTTAAVANAFISLAEDVVVAIGAWLSAFHPLILGALALAFLAAVAFLAPKVIRAVYIAAMIYYNYLRHVAIKFRRWVEPDWHPEEIPPALPSYVKDYARGEDTRHAARVLVGKYGRRRVGWLAVYGNLLIVVILKTFRRQVRAYPFADINHAKVSVGWTTDVLRLWARGEEVTLWFFKGRRPSAKEVAAAVGASGS